MRETNFTLRNMRWGMLSLVMTVFCINGTIAQPYCAMACNNNIQVSLNGDCEAEITFDMMLEDPWNDAICLPNGAQAFSVNVMDPNGVMLPSSPVVTCDQIGAYDALGGVVPVKVTHDATGNECWGTIIVEDKLDPVLNCPPISIMCNQVNANIPLPSVSDNCDNFPFATDCDVITLDFTEVWEDFGCVPNNGLSARVTRTYTATDASGNSTTCDQVIDLMRATLADVDLPPHYDGLPGNQPAIDCASACAAQLDADSESVTIPCVGYPTKNGIPIDVDGGYCEINVTFEDTRIDICDGSFKILRDYRLVDWCTGEIVDYTQIIKVIDDATDIICPAPATFGTNGGSTSCSWSGNIPAATVNENCSSFTVETRVFRQVPLPPYGLGSQTELFATLDGNGGFITLPIQDGCDEVFTIEYEITDDCGNHDICQTTITVEDDDAPLAICDEFTVVTLPPFPLCEATLFAENFDSGSYDNCTDVETYEVSTNQNGGFGPSITLDECGVTMVFMRVTDECGNTSEPCMIEVQADDKDDPIITCPADKTIECWTPFDDQGDATAVDCSDLDPITKQVIQQNIDPCGVGFVRIRFTATDKEGNSSNCIQRIDIVDSTPISVSFPPDRTVTCTTTGGGGYQGSLDPEDLPGNNTPNINGDDCELIAINYDDLVLTISDSACFKVLRTWTVINWCIFDADGPNTVANGVYQDVQEIKVVDNAAPVVDCPDDFEVCIFNDDCNATVNIPVPDADDCAPDDLLNYSVFGDFDSFVETAVEKDVYNVTVRVEDGCNNKTDCDIEITVTDCKNPTAYCKEGIIVTMMNTTPPMIEVWAIDLNDGSFDNCTDMDDLEISINTTNVNTGADGVTFDCDDLANGAEQAVWVYVVDECGNEDFCETFIIVQDNQGVCPNNPGDPLIAGTTNTTADFGNNPVHDVEVAINGGAMSDMVMTDANGYSLNVPAGGDYSVTPTLDTNPLNGVSTFDLVILRKHILGTQLLDSPYKMIAADINNSQSITTLDMVQLRKLILQIETTFTNNSSWRFVESAYSFPNAANPWAEVFPEVININNVNSAINNADFVAVKIGDLNGNANTVETLLGADDRSNGTMTINAENAELTRGEQITVDFTAADFAAVGYQFTLDFDQNALELVNVEGDSENFGLTLLDEGAITTSWNGEAANDVLFSLTFAANADVMLSEALSISSRFTAAEAYDASGNVNNVELNFNGSVANTEFELMQNTPNPFSTETVIGFNMPTEGAATLTIQDVSGKVITTIEREFVAGYNQVTVAGKDLPTTGVMYYTLKSGEYTATRKMIMVK